MAELCLSVQTLDLCLSFAAARLQKVQEKQQMNLQSLYFLTHDLKSVWSPVRYDDPALHCKVPAFCLGPPTEGLHFDCHLNELYPRACREEYFCPWNLAFFFCNLPIFFQAGLVCLFS